LEKQKKAINTKEFLTLITIGCFLNKHKKKKKGRGKKTQQHFFILPVGKIFFF